MPRGKTSKLVRYAKRHPSTKTSNNTNITTGSENHIKLWCMMTGGNPDKYEIKDSK